MRVTRPWTTFPASRLATRRCAGLSRSRFRTSLRETTTRWRSRSISITSQGSTLPTSRVGRLSRPSPVCERGRKACSGPILTSSPPGFARMTRTCTRLPTSMFSQVARLRVSRRDRIHRLSSWPRRVNSWISPMRGESSNSRAETTPCMRSPSSTNTSSPLRPTIVPSHTRRVWGPWSRSGGLDSRRLIVSTPGGRDAILPHATFEGSESSGSRRAGRPGTRTRRHQPSKGASDRCSRWFSTPFHSSASSIGSFCSSMTGQISASLAFSST